MMQARAHGVSLPLFVTMQRLEGAALDAATTQLRSSLDQLYLDEHVNLVLLLKDGGMTIDLEPVSDFGKAVLKELAARNLVVSCPEGECEFGGTGCCQWCGDVRKDH